MIALRRRMGITLVELIVALAILAIMTTVVGLTFRPAPFEQPVQPAAARAAAARRQALRTRQRVTVVIRIGDTIRTVTALPDGRVFADWDSGTDPLSGRIADAP